MFETRIQLDDCQLFLAVSESLLNCFGQTRSRTGSVYREPVLNDGNLSGQPIDRGG